MASIDTYVVAALACFSFSTACGGDDDSCERGEARGCTPEHNGPREYRYCQVDETWSDCTPEALCDPFAQTGCTEGLVCYLTYGSTTLCALAETLPCNPSCQTLCVSEGPGDLNEDPAHCADGELCTNAGLPSESVGVCYTPHDSGD